MDATIRIAASPIQVADCHAIAQLFESCFGKPPDANFSGRLNSKPKLICILAELDGKPVGFKIGYEKQAGIFFSWLGGIVPDQRRRGIARELLRRQHRLCMDMGYGEIQTETFGDVPAMLILNLTEGFEVFGTHLGNDNRIRVQLSKTLT